MVLAMDRAARIVYHADRTLKSKPVSEPFPGLESIANEVTANQSGVHEFGLNSSSYLAAYAPLPNLNVALVVARNRSDFTSSAHTWGIAGLLEKPISAVRPALASSAAAFARHPAATLQAIDLRKSFGGVVAVADISLTVEPNQIVGIIGANGYGGWKMFRKLEDKALGTSARNDLGSGIDINMSWDEYERKYLNK